MSDGNRVIDLQGYPVPGLKVAYHFQISEAGRALSYEAGVDSTISREELDALLDTIRGASERQKAIHDLPFHKMRLVQNEAKLPARRKELAVAIAGAQAKANRAASRERRNELQVNPADQQNIAKMEGALADLVATIEADRMEIPRLQAIIDGREPPAPALEEPMAIAAAE